MVETEWTAFLDSDDLMYREHLRVLLAGARLHRADYVFSYFEIGDRNGRLVGNADPLRLFGHVFDPERPTQTTITVLVRTELAQQVGFQAPPVGEMTAGQVAGEDFRFTCQCIDAGAKVVHIPRRTWLWRHWGVGTPNRPGNTSGLGSRW
jgi:hypothetical protein